MTAGFLIEFEPWTELDPAEEPEVPEVFSDAAVRFPVKEPEMAELWQEFPWIEDGVGGGIMAVIIETEDGEAISEATGVTESEPGLLSRPPVVEAERELATLRLI